ncbi:MAG TPA: hypothetical protein VL371_00390 [Gemmataceae bacterium]|nr:hypothetical protein [Gemmataceae bacterium]
MLRLILTTYLAFMTSAGPAVCCCLAMRPPSTSCPGQKCAAKKGCCNQAPAGCTKLPRRTTPCPCPTTTGGCCLQTPTIVAKNDVRGDVVQLLTDLPAFNQVADVTLPYLAASSELAVSEPFWPTSDLLHVHHRLRC